MLYGSVNYAWSMKYVSALSVYDDGARPLGATPCNQLHMPASRFKTCRQISENVWQDKKLTHKQEAKAIGKFLLLMGGVMNLAGYLFARTWISLFPSISCSGY